MADEKKSNEPSKATEKAVEQHREEAKALSLATPAQAQAYRDGKVELVEDPVHGLVPRTPLGEDGQPVRTQGDDEKRLGQ